MGFWRDSCGLLIFDKQGVASTDYPQLCRRIADVFGLTPARNLIVGPEQMFWEFQRGDLVVRLDWDIWMEFMCVAMSSEAEPLLHDIASWLSSNVGNAADAAGRVGRAESARPDAARLTQFVKSRHVGAGRLPPTHLLPRVGPRRLDPTYWSV
ncbi:MAG: hypothetical protein U0804_05845 [Gemmataceae bacterium]